MERSNGEWQAILDVAKAERDRLAAEVETLRKRVAELDRVQTLIACEGCGKGVRAGNTAGGKCVECVAAEVERLTRERDELKARVGQLEYLVCHCWIHSGYPDCGYLEMERPLRALYCEVIQREDGPNYQAPVTDAPDSWWDWRWTEDTKGAPGVPKD